MNPQDLIEEVAKDGVELYLRDDRLRYRAKETLRDETRKIIRTNKPALVAYLEGTAKRCGDAGPNPESARESNPAHSPPEDSVSDHDQKCGVEDRFRDDDPIPVEADALPGGARLDFVMANATEEELQLLEPPAQLSIAELYNRLQVRHVAIKEFFGTYPRYLETIADFKESGWSPEDILEYVGRYQPEVTLAYIDYALAMRRPAGSYFLRRAPHQHTPSPVEPLFWDAETAGLANSTNNTSRQKSPNKKRCPGSSADPSDLKAGAKK